MNSMTGFGRGEATNGDVTVVVEMKSVNNRFRDLQLRVPREHMVLEPRLHTMLRDAVQRGRIEVYVRRSAVESGSRVHSDPALAERYGQAIRAILARLGRPDEPIPLALVLSQPGVMSMVEAEPDALREWDLVATAVEVALADLLAMRATEGQALQRDLQRHLDELLRLLAEVDGAAEGVAERLRARLDQRIQRLVGDRVDPDRLAAEAALLADKADISEELARSQAHCAQFADALVMNEPVGRKLDFLLQELNREINTIGSKSSEHPISARVVEMKATLERMREQAANVE